MQPSDNIQKELESIGAHLECSNTTLPYNVPQGYFEELPHHVMAIIQCAHKDDPTLNITTNIPYSIPEQYFDTLPEKVLSEIKHQEALVNSFVQSLPSALPFEAPNTDYFTNLVDNVFNTIHQVESEEPELSDTLAGLKDKKAYAVPEGYFSKEISIKPQHQEKQTSIPFRRRSTWLRPAMAAAIMFIISVTGWQFLNGNFNESTNIDVKYQRQLAQLSKADISNYIAEHIDEFDENTLMTSVSLDKSTSNNNQNDVLSNISDEQIQEYFENM